jgi:hypothetical protein
MQAAGSQYGIRTTCRGELLRTWGDAVYPVEYVYDLLGRRTELHTFRTGTSWSNASWSTASSGNTPDVTTWIYEPGTGLLTAKQYQGHNPPSTMRNIEYDYTTDGKLQHAT